MPAKLNIQAALAAAVFVAVGSIAALRPLPAAAQQPPAYVTGVDFMNPKPDCPVFIGYVTAGAPAEKAGLKSGDAIVSIDGVPIQTLADLRKLSSGKPKPVRMVVTRADGKHAYDVGREPFTEVLARQGRKLSAGGRIVPADMTEAEVERMVSFDPSRIAESVFPERYPAGPALYYGGFEVLTLQSPADVIVGGMEDGPATHAGVHSGDVILAVNGKHPKGLSVADLEKLFTSLAPAKMRLRVRRLEEEREFDFPLWKTADVLKVNQKQLVQGQVLPAGIAAKDQHCFLRE